MSGNTDEVGADGDEKTAGAEETEPSPAEFVAGLQPHERVLLELKERLYDGSWARLRTDLEARRDNKPYIFKLSKAIERDLQAVARLEAYEKRWGISLQEELSK